ncbi:MAG: FtsX-like permease family protein [Bacteroidota bacterium]
MKPNGNITIVYFLSAIAVFILSLAYLNYINLSTAQAMTRAKEVGIRKVLGAVKPQLSRQFLLESLVMNVAAIVIAVIVVVFAQPYFVQFTGANSSVFEQKTSMLMILLVLLTGAFLSGLYPAFVLSGFNPVSSLKGKLINSRSGISLRKALVVFQYTISTVLAIGTFVIYFQVDFMLNRDLGMNIDQTLILKAPSAIAEDSVGANKFVVFRERVLANPSIRSFTASTEIPGKEIGQLREGQVRRIGADIKDANNYYVMGIDSAFFRAFEMQMLSGRDFTGDVNFYENVVLNRAAARLLGFQHPEDAVGMMINCFGVNRVIGVVENYNQQSLKSSYSPIIFYLRNPAMLYSYYAVKLNTADISSSLTSIEQDWKESFAGNPFEYFFLDDFFNEQYRGDKQFRSMFTTFSVLALLIASLGLFGLSSHTLMLQSKEIGIRKVLGAKVIQLFGILSFEFLKLVLLSNIIALPLSYWIAQRWLSNFAFRIENNWWLYVLPCVLTVFLSLLVVSYQVIKSSLSNPIKVIREN